MVLNNTGKWPNTYETDANRAIRIATRSEEALQNHILSFWCSNLLFGPFLQMNAEIGKCQSRNQQAWVFSLRKKPFARGERSAALLFLFLLILLSSSINPLSPPLSSFLSFSFVFLLSPFPMSFSSFPCGYSSSFFFFHPRPPPPPPPPPFLILFFFLLSSCFYVSFVFVFFCFYLFCSSVLLRGPSGDRIARSCHHTAPDPTVKIGVIDKIS